MKKAEAVEFFKAKIKINPRDASAHHNLSVLLNSEGKKESMEQYMRHCRIALLITNKQPVLFNEMGLALLEDGKEALASLHFHEAISLMPNFYQAHMNIAAIYSRTGKYKQALPHCLTAVKLAPKLPAAHRNIAKVYDKLGYTRESLNHNKIALQLEPSDASLYRTIAMQSTCKGDIDQAHLHYDEYRKVTGKKYVLNV